MLSDLPAKKIEIVAQIGFSTEETWAARVENHAWPARIEDIPSLPKAGWMPVGTVEFCRAAMAHQGIPEPEPLDYPVCLEPWMPYIHSQMPYAEIPDKERLHIKPVITKLDESLWKPDTLFWVSNIHRFASEWRVYVLHGRIVGMGRYDDRDVDFEDAYPNITVIQEMVDTYTRHGAPAGYGMDVGVSDEDGMTKLVEVNDGWALGLYKGSCSRKNYLELLRARWMELAMPASENP